MSYLYKEVRRILLIDRDARKRTLRAAVLRSHEFEVHTAASVAEATPCWKTTLYDLVLLAEPQHADSAAWIAQIRNDRTRQRIGLLVGPPSYIQEVRRTQAKTKPAGCKQNGAISKAALDESAVTIWEKTIHSVMSDWCTEHATAFRLHEAVDRSAQYSAGAFSPRRSKQISHAVGARP